MHSVRKCIIIASALTLALTACSPEPLSSARPAWDTFAAGFLETYFKNNPTMAVSQGRHEYDGRLPDWSEAGLEAWIGRLHQLRDSAAAFVIAETDTARRFERDYLIAKIDQDLFWREKADWPHRNPEFYAGGIDPSVYVTREYAPAGVRMKAFTTYAGNLPASLARIRANLRTPMPRTYAQIAYGRLSGLAEYFETSVPQAFAEVKDSSLLRDFEPAKAKATVALRDLAAWFAGEEKRGTGAYALGPELFSEMLRMTEGVDVPLDSLERRGREDLERNLAALKDACSRFAPGATTAQCVGRMSAHKASGSPVPTAEKQLDTLEAFVKARDLVSVPGTERARVAEAPLYRRFNVAYIEIPGAYEKNQPSTYYLAPPDPAWPTAKKLAYIPGAADLCFISIHEVWPGHFLNFLHARRVPSTIARVFVGYAYAEGWGHYAEEMMWEAGYGDGNPEIHIGQLTNALTRDVRYLSAIGLHTRGMTVEASERLFKDKAFKDDGGAEQQALRGTYDPAYLNYTLGKLMILKLRDDWTATRGGREAWRDFHDRFLSYGGPPIPMVRKAMLGDAKGVL